MPWKSRMLRLAIPMTLALAVIAQFPSNQVAVAQNTYNPPPTNPFPNPETEEKDAEKAVKTATAVVFGGGVLDIVLHPKALFSKPDPNAPPLPTAANQDKSTSRSRTAKNETTPATTPGR